MTCIITYLPTSPPWAGPQRVGCPEQPRPARVWSGHKVGTARDSGLYGQGTCGAPSGSHVAQALALTEHDGCGQGHQASSFSLGAAGGARQREQQWEPCAPCPHLPTHSPDGKPEAAEASPAQHSVARTCCGRAPRLAGRLGLRALSRRALLSFATPPPLSPLSPCLLLLQLPRVVNSLKLLIKNILLSPPQGLLPCDFPLRRRHGRKGGGGRAVAKEWGSAFLGLHGGCRGTGAWLPPAPCHSPWLPGSVGRHFRRLQPWVSWRQEWRQLPRALCSLLPPRPTGPLAQAVAQAHFHWRQGALPSRESAARSSSLGVTLSPLVSDGEVSLGSTSSGKMQSRLVS